MKSRNDSRPFDISTPRIKALRAKDPYFDALCETYEDLDRQIGAAETGPATSLERERLKRQRSGCLDTIVFMLDDASTKHAA